MEGCAEMSKQHTDDPELLRLVSLALEMRADGIEPPLTELCAERPDLIPAVASAIGIANKLPDLQVASANADRFAQRELGGRYRLLKRIGAGSMGVVYRAEDLELRRSVAVKILRADLWREDEAAARFAREAESLAAVQHRTIVTVFDRGVTDDGLHFLVMELLDGVPLGDLLDHAGRLAGERGRVDAVTDTDWIAHSLGPHAELDGSYLRAVVRWVAELARGLEVAHAAGVLHRDCKPSNVFIRRDGTPVLLDFGIAARTAEATLAVREGALGTPAYMAPEAIEGARECGVAADVYGLAATLYHLLTFQPPYRGTPTQVLALLMRRDPQPAYVLRPGLPRDLQAILDRGMARQPAARYPTPVEFAEDLEAFLKYRPVVARPISQWRRLWRRVHRSREFRVGMLIAGIVLLMLGGFAWRESALAEARRAWLESWSRVPPTLVTLPKSMRIAPDNPRRESIERLLDRAVDTGAFRVAAHATRAMFRVDGEDFAGAAADMQIVSDVTGTPYARALAEAYRRLATGRELDLGGLPEPSESTDRYLAALHVIRADVTAARRAVELLQDPGGVFASSDLFLQAASQAAALTRPGAEQLRAFRELHEHAIRYEQTLGRRTASTALAIGMALAGQSRTEEALDAFRDGASLAPGDATLRLNLGTALRRIGDSARAATELRAAIELRPTSVAAREALVLALNDLGDFDAAEAEIEAAPYPDTPKGTRKRAKMRGKVDLGRAMAAMLARRSAEAQQHAMNALTHFVEARDPHRGESADLLISRALARQSVDGVFADLARAIHRHPTSWRDIRNLASLLPDRPTDDQVAALRSYLQALSRHLAPASAENEAGSTDSDSTPK